MSEYSEYVAAGAVFIGTLFLVLAALALLRMPDVYCRLSASTKAVTFGAGMMMLGAAISLDAGAATTRAIAGIAFYFVTSPVAAHVLARAAHLRGTPLWEGSIIDESAADDAPRTGPVPEQHEPLHPAERDSGA
jgi:multicomponent Na+:H+ antiporter subunit G